MGFVRKGVVVIHGIALNTADFKEMAEKGMYLVWSPQSNWTLYRETADIPAALAAGVIVALAPDWTITGSDNLLEEMKFASAYSRSLPWHGRELSPKELFRMATIDAAKVAGVEDSLGKITVGYGADFFLASQLDDPKKTKGSPDPFASLLRTYPRDIKLVFVGGRPIYGDEVEMQKLLPAGSYDVIDVQGVRKGIVTTGPPGSDSHAWERYGDIRGQLERALPKIAPLIEN
jgi:cytosine/adenosine deaminase-related metal-dependent hydrolase